MLRKLTIALTGAAALGLLSLVPNAAEAGHFHKICKWSHWHGHFHCKLVYHGDYGNCFWVFKPWGRVKVCRY